jgi:lipopolysaccharide biosynthesis protein
MSTAVDKRESHIVEYLLFVWQMEDLARAADFEVGAIRSMFNGVDSPDLEWLLKLTQDMKKEGLQEKGHVAHAIETLTELALLHDLLTGPMEDSNYVKTFESAQPFLTELQEKKQGAGSMMHPTEQMLTALYGWLVLRMKKETISVETEAAMVAIRQMANVLARGHIRVYEGR